MTSTSRRRGGVVIAVALAALTVAGCREDGGTTATDPGTVPGSDEPTTATIEVTTQGWSGWSPDHQPEPESSRVEVEEGDAFDVELSGETVEFTVQSVAEDAVVLTVPSQGLQYDNAPVGTEAGRDTFTVEVTVSRPAELGTTTMDAGTNLTLWLP